MLTRLAPTNGPTSPRRFRSAAVRRSKERQFACVIAVLPGKSMPPFDLTYDKSRQNRAGKTILCLPARPLAFARSQPRRSALLMSARVPKKPRLFTSHVCPHATTQKKRLLQALHTDPRCKDTPVSAHEATLPAYIGKRRHPAPRIILPQTHPFQRPARHRPWPALFRQAVAPVLPGTRALNSSFLRVCHDMPHKTHLPKYRKRVPLLNSQVSRKRAHMAKLAG